MFRKWFKMAFILGIIGILLVILIHYWVSIAHQQRIYSSADTIPKNRVGLVLGTTKHLKGGYVNLYFTYRIRATVELFQKGKIDYVLVSGDNSSHLYDEPTDFKEELISKGIPENRIFLDYAGFRTLDSVVRAKKVFGQTQFTIISQPFHNERAVFIAQYKGINAIAYNAQGVPNRYGIRVVLREYLARVKLLYDLLMRVQPKFLGEPVEIK